MEGSDPDPIHKPDPRDGEPKARLRRVASVDDNEDRLLNKDDDVSHNNHEDNDDELRNEASKVNDKEKVDKEQESFCNKFSLTHFIVIFLVERLIGFVVRWVWTVNGSPDLVTALEFPSMILCAFLETILMVSVIAKMTAKNDTTEKRAMKVFYFVTLIKILTASVLFGLKSWSMIDILNILSYQSWIFVQYATENPHSRFWKLFLVEESVKATLLLVCVIDTFFPIDSEPSDSMELIVIIAFFFVGTFSMINLLTTLFNSFYIIGIRFKFLALLVSFRLHYFLFDHSLDDFISPFLLP